MLRILPRAEASNLVQELLKKNPGFEAFSILCGDRWECVDEVVSIEVELEIVGIATLAHRGEQMNGKPTIVAIYVPPGYRGFGFGFKLLEASVDHLISKGLKPIHVDVINPKVFSIIEKLPIEKKGSLEIVDATVDIHAIFRSLGH